MRLVRATVPCRLAAIFSVSNGKSDIVCLDGSGNFHRPSLEAFVEAVAMEANALSSSECADGAPCMLGIPLSAEPEDVAGVLVILDPRDQEVLEPGHQTVLDLQGVLTSLVTTSHAHRQAAERQTELHMTLEQMDQGLTVFDANARLTLWNKRYVDLFELDPAIVFKGARLADLIASKNTETRLIGFTAQYEAMLKELREGLARGEIVTGGAELDNGRIISSVHAAMPGGGWVATHSDITERVRAEEKIKHASEHDSMTGLVNRATFNAEYERRAADGQRLVVMLVDIDHFKAVNDNFGHGAGDAVIISVAERLRSCVRQADVVARLGGDEFAVLFQLDQRDPANMSEVLAEKVVGRMRRELNHKGAVINFSVSVGFHEAHGAEGSLEEALSCADFALYKAKENGRGRFQPFDTGIERELSNARRIQALVREDTYARQLTMHYQPIVHIDSRAEYGYEALIRWAGTRSEYIAPSDIIEAAEQNGSIVSLGEWVLNQALRQADLWQTNLQLAVNVSPKQLGQGVFLEQVKTALERWNVSPDTLELEVTETAVLQDQASIDELHGIKQLGVRIALDDFGTGYSSLTLLQQFPFDKLKIDRSFVDQVDTDPLSRAIVSSVTQLGRDLKVRTVAEGIETEQHLNVMAAVGCCLGQGFLIGKPMAPDDICQSTIRSLDAA
ncbi:MAG: EAL domain-containing protein [Pseudomonadota bacterium]